MQEHHLPVYVAVEYFIIFDGKYPQKKQKTKDLREKSV